MSPNSSTFFSSELMVVRNMVLLMRRLPDGVITLLRATDSTTWSGVKLWLRNLSGSTLITTDRELAPKGGGADKPGTVANIGRIRVAARSYISFKLLSGLLKTNCPTGSDEASNRITCGGKAPG